MPTLNIHLDISGKDEKLLFGPITEPSPGPTFDIEVAAPDKEVKKSSPVNESNVANKKKLLNTYK